jgi:hypothetical protein
MNKPLHLDPDFGLGWFRLWFRAQPKVVQWPLGLLIVVLSIIGSIPPESTPGQPRQAFIVTLALFVVALVLSELLRPKPNFEDARPATLSDFDVPTATEGRVVPLVFGRTIIKGPNVVWYGDLEQTAIVEKVKTGLWSSQRITKGFRYSLGIQFALCRGPGVVLRSVRIGEKDAFTGTITGPEGRFDIQDSEFLGGDEFGVGGIATTCDFYSGEPDQPVNGYLNDPDRQQIATAATPTAPRYAGTAYVVAREYTSAAPVPGNGGAYVGNSTSIKPWAFEVERYPPLFQGQNTGENKIGSEGDCNPINVLYELLTNVEWGFGFAASTIDTGSGSTFLRAADAAIAEGLGFSMLLERQLAANELVAEIERHIDGAVFLDQTTGKWSLQLARGPDDAFFGYDINTVAQLSDDDISAINDFTRGSWEDTTNQISVEFAKRSDRYKISFALAQDMGNAILRGGGNVSTPKSNPGQVKMPGVKSAATASQIAWRELRLQSYPLARVTLETNRKFYDLKIGGVFAWTNARRGFTKLPMRVLSIDYGSPTSNKMTIKAVQDVFQFAAASMGDPPPSGWIPPSTVLQAYPTDSQIAFEAPRAIVVRDPSYGGNQDVSKVWAAARRRSGEVAFEIHQRNSTGTPAGSFALAGTVTQFLRIGELASDLDAGTAVPTSAITVSPSPDSQTNIESVFDDGATLGDLGTDLSSLILVGTEFMLVTRAVNNGSDVDLENVYRGVLDSAQENHAAGTPVLLLFVGGGITDTNFPTTNNVDIELRARSSSAVFSGPVNTISLTMDRRAIRPYPPSVVFYNGSSTEFGTPDAEGDGTGLNGVGFDVSWWRRRYDTPGELIGLLLDEVPDASTEYRVRVYVDPSVSNDLAFDSGWVSGAGPVTPTLAELVTFAAVGTEVRVRIDARHDVGTLTNLESRNAFIHDVVPTTSRGGQFYLGGDLRANIASNAYTVTTAGVHNVTIGAAYATSNVQIRINGGAWATVVAAGGTTGATAALSISDTVELRHTANEAPDPQFVEIDDGTSAVAYGAFSS